MALNVESSTLLEGVFEGTGVGTILYLVGKILTTIGAFPSHTPEMLLGLGILLGVGQAISESRRRKNNGGNQ